MKIIILENIRSAYNVGNIIRTADALGWQVRLTGYTPSPVDNKKVVKTSL
jgi:tRNA G18 (ribose-2'-O)-methylase SpoU